MKKFIFPFLLLVILLSVFPFLDNSKDTKIYTGFPWQIEVLLDGSTQVFGLHIGKSTLSDALGTLGTDMEVAVIAAPDEIGNLEMYYGHYRAGLLSGKLIIRTQSNDEDIMRWRENAINNKIMPSGGARKYTFSENDLAFALTEVITAITFIPTVNLDDEIIRKRFGEPYKRIQLSGVTHYQYPDKGLDIALHDDSKEVLQYVSPDSFQALSR